MFGFTPVRVVPFLLVWFRPVLRGRRPDHPQTSAEILVRVTFENDRAAGDQHTSGALRDDSEIPVERHLPTPRGRATFHVTWPDSTGCWCRDPASRHIVGNTSHR